MSKQSRLSAALTWRRLLGLAAAVALGAGVAAAAVNGRTDLAIAVLAFANALVLIATVRLHRQSRRSAATQQRLQRKLEADVDRLSQQVDALGGGLEQALKDFGDRQEFADQRLLKTIELERLRSEERHLELTRSKAKTADRNAPETSANGAEGSGN